MNAQIIALSADHEPAAVKLIAKHDLESPSVTARTPLLWPRQPEQPDALFDPWGPRPDYVISSLSELAGILPAS